MTFTAIFYYLQQKKSKTSHFHFLLKTGEDNQDSGLNSTVY